MSDAANVDLFVEDRAHEALLTPLVRRIAREEGVAVQVSTRAARGGHARALAEFDTYQRLVEKGALRDSVPAVVVVAIDGNCSKSSTKKAEIEHSTLPRFREGLVVACPDPHIERWFLADPDSFHAVVGYRPTFGKRKCVRDEYKRLLAGAVRAAGHPPTLGGIEFARELADAMDLYRAGKADPSLGAFVADLRARLRRISADPALEAAGGSPSTR